MFCLARLFLKNSLKRFLGRERERQRDRETERQRDRETERQRDRELREATVHPINYYISNSKTFYSVSVSASVTAINSDKN